MRQGREEAKENLRRGREEEEMAKEKESCHSA